MFAYCNNLVSDIVVTKVSDAKSMFYGCSKLTGNVSVGADYSKNCYSMFAGCSNLSGVAIDNINNASYMFSGCSKLTSVSLLNANNEADYIGAFENCHLLNQSLSINANNASNIFANCIILNKPMTISAYDFSGAFDGCTNYNQLTQLIIKGNNAPAVRAFANTAMNQPMITGNYNNCEGIYENCCQFNQPLYIDNRCESYNYAFKNCVNLKQDIVVERANKMRYMFDGCTNLSKVTLNFSIAFSSDFYGMFANKNMSKQLFIYTNKATGLSDSAFKTIMSEIILGNSTRLTWDSGYRYISNSQYAVTVYYD